MLHDKVQEAMREAYCTSYQTSSIVPKRIEHAVSAEAFLKIQQAYSMDILQTNDMCRAVRARTAAHAFARSVHCG